MRKLMVTFIFTIMLVGCSNNNMVKPDTTFNAAYLMKYQIHKQNYINFQSLFRNGYENTISKETFEQFSQLSTDASSHRTFELITFENGEMLLVEFYPKLEDEDEFKIADIKVVSDEMKSLFTY